MTKKYNVPAHIEPSHHIKEPGGWMKYGQAPIAMIEPIERFKQLQDWEDPFMPLMHAEDLYPGEFRQAVRRIYKKVASPTKR